MDFITKFFTGAKVRSITPAEAQEKRAQKAKPFLLDVRQPEEYRTGHIPGAKLIPLGELSQRIQELPKEREIICVCQSGSRSLSATRQLNAAGYQVINLLGGMNAWGRAGFEVKRG